MGHYFFLPMFILVNVNLPITYYICNMKIYRKFQYADLKRVSRAYISKLIRSKRLITKNELGEECIVDCVENDAIFKVFKKEKKLFG